MARPQLLVVYFNDELLNCYHAIKTSHSWGYFRVVRIIDLWVTDFMSYKRVKVCFVVYFTLNLLSIIFYFAIKVKLV